MNIQKINSLSLNSNSQQKVQNKNYATPQIKTNNLPQFAYRDYNVSFGERLFRTPANFFEQDFNRNNMPVTMKRYLFADYDDRQNMPPNQMLKLVFDDINIADNLEDVKYLFPNEPLFENLSDEPQVKARTGVIAEIETMREEGKTLFKNGQDNLGFYILKKIYLEGKSLKEINHDFERDISVYYKGLSPIQYETLSAYGIKFPKNAFWKSFTATREDFPYEYKPRKPIEDRATSSHSGRVGTEVTPKRQIKKFEDVKDWQIDKLTAAMLDGNGNTEQTRRSLKRNSAGDPEALNFVAKYMGEINSVVLEKLHVSEEMKDFFENYDNLTDTQKVKFKKYWDNPEIKDLRSLVMSSTIRFFFDVYGVDGNNDEFKELIEYAHNIKAERLKREEEHNRVQAEYDELFANYFPAEESEKPVEEEPVVIPTQRELFDDKIRQTARENNAKIYTYELSTGTTFSVLANYDEMIRDRLAEDMAYFPKSYRDDYRRFILKQGESNDKFLVSLFFNVKGLEELPMVVTSDNSGVSHNNSEFEMFKKEYLLSADEVNALSLNFNEKYINSHIMQHNAVSQVLSELLYMTQPTVERFEELAQIREDALKTDYPEMSAEDARKMALRDVRRVTDQYSGKEIAQLSVSDVHRGLTLFDVKPKDVQQYVESRYSIYNQPLTPKETQKIAKVFVNKLTHYDVKNSIVDDKRTQNIVKTLSENLNISSNNKNIFAQGIANSLPKQNGDFRAFLLSNSSEELLDAKAEIFLINYINQNPNMVYPLLAINKENLDKYIAPVDMKLYNSMMQYRILQSIRR